MIGVMPNFYNSKYFVDKEDNWHLLEGAPADEVEEMREFRKEHYGDENVYGKKDVKKSFTDAINELLAPFKEE